MFVKHLLTALMVTALSPQKLSSLLPAGFGKTHFIQGVDQYPVQEKQEVLQQSGEYYALFSPTHDICGTLCSLIDKEQQQIFIAIYTITDKKIATALINAHQRGVKIELITDRGSTTDKFTKIHLLSKSGISVNIYQTPEDKNGVRNGLMHNKFSLFFSQEVLWIGSFNFSLSAQKYNRESVLYAYRSPLFADFRKEFQEIKKNSRVHTEF